MSDRIRQIGIFDSGVGGLSIFLAIRKALPHLTCIYTCDNKNFPYGPKSENEVNGFVMEAVDKLTREHKIDLLVVACNTASTVALNLLRSKLSVPVVGVVPAIKPAARLSKTKVIGLLATPGTIKRAYTDQLVSDFAKGCEVIKVGSSLLVDMAEAKLRGHPVDLEAMRKEIH